MAYPEHRLRYLWITQFDWDAEDVPINVLRWFQSPPASEAYRVYMEVMSDRDRIRTDNLIQRMVGRHPVEIHPGNHMLCYEVWRERWNIAQLFADEPEVEAPRTPPRVE